MNRGKVWFCAHALIFTLPRLFSVRYLSFCSLFPSPPHKWVIDHIWNFLRSTMAPHVDMKRALRDVSVCQDRGGIENMLGMMKRRREEWVAGGRRRKMAAAEMEHANLGALFEQ